ncbi:DUF3300 domain-containing protein, partial [Methylobacterium sp. WL103]
MGSLFRAAGTPRRPVNAAPARQGSSTGRRSSAQAGWIGAGRLARRKSAGSAQVGACRSGGGGVRRGGGGGGAGRGGVAGRVGGGGGV